MNTKPADVVLRPAQFEDLTEAGRQFFLKIFALESLLINSDKESDVTDSRDLQGIGLILQAAVQEFKKPFQDLYESGVDFQPWERHWTSPEVPNA